LTVVTPPEAFGVYLPKILNVTPAPVNVPEIVTLFLCDAEAKDSASMASPFGMTVVVVVGDGVVVVVEVVVVEEAPADVATSTVRRLRGTINNRGARPVIAVPLVRAAYDDDANRIPGPLANAGQLAIGVLDEAFAS
jgi:hypothetical protein